MAGDFDVVTEELREAAGDIRDAAAPVAGWTMPSDGASAASFGHDQVAEVFANLCQKLTETVSAGYDSLQAAATDLDSTATSYDTTDQSAGVLLHGYGQVLPQ